MIKISKKHFSFLFLLFLGVLIINDVYAFDSPADAINLPYLFNEFFAGITGYAVRMLHFPKIYPDLSYTGI